MGSGAREVALTQDELTARWGERARPSTVLADLARRGLIEDGRRRVEILDPVALRGQIWY